MSLSDLGLLVCDRIHYSAWGHAESVSYTSGGVTQTILVLWTGDDAAATAQTGQSLATGTRVGARCRVPVSTLATVDGKATIVRKGETYSQVQPPALTGEHEWQLTLGMPREARLGRGAGK